MNVVLFFYPHSYLAVTYSRLILMFIPTEIKLKNDMENHQLMCLSDLEIQAPGDIVSKKASVNVHQKTTGKENHGDVRRLGK